MRLLNSEREDAAGKRNRRLGMPARLELAVLLGVAFAVSLPGQINEYDVKALFLYQFAKYVEWPSQVFKTPGGPVVICILGENPFGSAMDRVTNGKMVEGRPFVVRQISDLPGSRDCHILFVNSSERKRFRAMIGSLKGLGILTVGEMRGFIADGGVINFKLEDGKVRFEINADAAADQHLHISSKLLSLAATAND
jgi:hypothetical protein